jgi:hypothetical protein
VAPFLIGTIALQFEQGGILGVVFFLLFQKKLVKAVT